MTLQRLATPVFIAAALLAGAAHAQTAAAGSAATAAATAVVSTAPHVSVEGAWARASVPGQKATGAFMRLTAPEALRLVRAQSPAAGVTEVHEMKMDGDVMKMRAIPALELPAGEQVKLAPGGLHLMMMDLKQPITAGQTLNFTLTLEDANGKRRERQIEAQVRSGATAGQDGGHGAHQHH